MRLSYVVALGLLLFGAEAAAKSTRSLFFISDLHLGPGHDRPGHWDNYEDFRWSGDFAAFLDEVDRRGHSQAELLLNGDSLELWQSHDTPCTYSDLKDLNLGCSEDDAQRRIGRVIEQHRDVLQLIGNFAKRGDNHVTVIPGNHDVALLIPSVRQALVDAIAAPGRIDFALSGSWHTDDGLIFAEHGHEIGEDVNGFDGWPKPFIMKQPIQTKPPIQYLRRPWGERLVQDFYNQYEMQFPIIDNLSSEAAGVRYGMKASGSSAGFKAIGRFLKFLLVQESWNQFGHLLGGAGGGAAPEWNLAAVKASKDHFLLESLADDDPLRAAAADAVKDGRMDVSAGQLTNDDLAGICDYRAALAKSGKTIDTCPQSNLGGGGDTLGAISESIFVRRNTVFRKHFSAMGQVAKKMKTFVYSHTHKADEFDVTAPNVHVLNTGAWQRLITPDRLEQKAKALHIAPAEAFKRFTPEDLDACYTFVQVDPYDSEPRAKLLAWSNSSAGWRVANGCP